MAGSRSIWKQRVRNLSAPILLGLVVAVVVVAAWLWQRAEPLPDGLIQANGRIEGDRLLASSKTAGRVIDLQVREGDTVESGQILARLDDSQVRARFDQARAAVEAQAARMRATQVELAVLERDVPLAVEIAREAVVEAKARLAAAAATEEQAVRDADRMTALFGQGTIDAQRNEKAALDLKVARSENTAARTGLARARQRLSDAELGARRIEAKKAELQSLEAQLAQTDAAASEAQANLDDLEIPAPGAGVVTTRIADLGEVIVAGAPLFEIVDLDRLYLEVYIAEKEIGKLRRGLPARIHTDAFPDDPFPAIVRFISSRAEFTPKEVQTVDERAKLVYAVKLYLEENPDHRLTPGLPADAIIRWKEDAPWVKPRW